MDRWGLSLERRVWFLDIIVTEVWFQRNKIIFLSYFFLSSAEYLSEKEKYFPSTFHMNSVEQKFPLIIPPPRNGYQALSSLTDEVNSGTCTCLLSHVLFCCFTCSPLVYPAFMATSSLSHWQQDFLGHRLSQFNICSTGSLGGLSSSLDRSKNTQTSGCSSSSHHMAAFSFQPPTTGTVQCQQLFPW